jgi:hypothetical protein
MFAIFRNIFAEKYEEKIGDFRRKIWRKNWRFSRKAKFSQKKLS